MTTAREPSRRHSTPPDHPARWEITGPPDGSGPNANNWERTDASGLPVGASIATPRSLLMGSGFEGISTVAERNEVLGRALEHLVE